jgi:hypothetical protein
MDEDDWDAWMEMSEAEQQAELDYWNRRLEENRNRMSCEQLYAVQRASWLKSCLSWRRLIRQDFIPAVASEHLRGCQIQLWRLRWWRSTGHFPGEA